MNPFPCSVRRTKLWPPLIDNLSSLRIGPRRMSLLTWPPLKKEAVLTAPNELSEEEVLRITPSLVLGLARLRFQRSRTYREGETRLITSGATKGRKKRAQTSRPCHSLVS
jgi:hypothetical protein